ncbi:hypothetical protein BEWA_041080 [Theileria equi strain WA]|uniref:Uncharacterized protein n=1 Tax=Theileria equi strain WA TaxID=1537102 RepID=L1LFN7_THEEQ|nr:hypothetical protein BEWA_041080 [Theileria equi strain WA]EKX74070.1 hypothetical protein BEWA_041080 [Theileria equi strain WA]|eukprot:XP_004833522.1 hypothetical protein BEWA_041080 [Theileria equi strain WA]
MTQQEVTIEFKYNHNANGGDHTYQASTIGGNNVKITVRKSEEPSGSDFYRYTHTLQNGGSFTLKTVLDDSGKKINIPEPKGVSELRKINLEKVTSVSAYCWNGNPTKVLIIGITTTDRGTTYYGNRKSADGNNEWTRLHGGSRPNLINGDIERTLDDLVCEHHGAVTIDLSKGTSMSGNKPYCCRCDGHNNTKISLSSGKVPAVPTVEYYKHTINSGQLARIRYYFDGVGTDPRKTNDPDKRRRIKSPELGFPTLSVQAVYAFYCGGNPVLIYIEGNGDGGTNSWYKKPTSNGNTDEQWTKVQDLKDITPDNITECEQYNKLAAELSCARTVPCPLPQSPPPPLAPSSNIDSGASGPHPAQQKAESAPHTPTASEDEALAANPPQTEETPKTAKSIGLLLTGSSALAGYVVPSVFGGSGAVGLAGYHLYKNSRDPWVRQI